MTKTAVDPQHASAVQTLVNLVANNGARQVYVTTGRVYDKIFVDGAVRYFVARHSQPTADITAGDIFGRRTDHYPNPRWFFGNLANIDKWDWTGYHGVPVSDDTVVKTKAYGDYVHYARKK
jgi:hypothetical protein